MGWRHPGAQVLSVPNPQVPGTTGMFPVPDSPFVKVGLIWLAGFWDPAPAWLLRQNHRNLPGLT